MLKRSEVKLEETWDLSHLFETEQAFEEAMKNVLKVSNQIEEEFKGKIDSAKKLP